MQVATQNITVPKLRFKGFDDELTTKKIDSISSLIKDGSHGTHKEDKSSEFLLLSAKNIKNGVVNVGNNERRISEKDYNAIYKNYSLKKDDILLTIVGTIGRTAIVENLEKIAFQRSVAFFRFDEQISKYIFQLFNSEKFQRELNKRKVVSAQPGIYLGDLSKINLNLPTLSEQEKIASFLSSVDDGIQKLERKKSLLEEYKKGVMQKIFSQELRFKDDNGNNYPDWEEKRLWQVMSERNTKAPKSDKFPLMSFVARKGVAPKGERYNREFLVNDEDNKKYKQTEYGDFIYSSNNLETGSIGLNIYGSASISPVYSIFQIGNSCNYKFISSYLIRKLFIYKMIRFRQGVVYGQWRIHESEFLKIKEFFPSLKEQEKIASFLNGIDKKIELVETQIQQSKTFKKGLLQQMFV